MDGAKLTDTCGLVLGKSRGALAGEASDGVHTEELAVVLLGGAFVQVCVSKCHIVYKPLLTLMDFKCHITNLFIH